MTAQRQAEAIDQQSVLYHALGGELFASEDRVADGINDLCELSGDGENRNKVDVEHGEVGQRICGLQHGPRPSMRTCTCLCVCVCVCVCFIFVCVYSCVCVFLCV